ncbi:MAG: F0F1 ATP synthase subunit epsilon [Ignavibacteriae bacterium]|nr:F0F1 ATP synthase subunit epsilon [Ignavibacteriota bacterium]
MEKVIEIEIVSPVRSVYSGKVRSASVPGVKGLFQVLYNHAPMVSVFEIGIIKLVDENGSETVFSTSGGILEVRDNKIIILADTAETVEDIDKERAKNAMKRAEERLSSKDIKLDRDRAKLSLKRARNRLQVAEKQVLKGLI